MEQSYFLYSTKMQGWMTRTGVYDSDHAAAARYGRTEAFTLARKHLDQGRAVLIPVVVNDLLEVVG